MKTAWKTACSALCLCALLVWVTSCPQSAGNGNGGASTDFTTLYVSVTDSIGGTAVDGTTLRVYESGNTLQFQSDFRVTNGKVRVSGISTNKRYDFELIGIKGKWAGSRLENYSPLKEAEQTLSIIQSEHAMITRGITPPKITSIQSGNGTFTDIDESTVISSSDKVRVVFDSDVGAVEETASGAFGAKLGIDKAPNNLSGIYGRYSVSQAGGVIKSTYTFSFSEVPNGTGELIAVGYDVAHNRIEKHIPVTFQGSSAAASDLSTCTFDRLSVNTERLPFSENLFSLNPVENRRSSYRVLVRFTLKKFGMDEKILGFDLYRKKTGYAQDFRFVSRTLYNELKNETQSGWGFHVGIDSDSLLEEDTEYEYKIRVFNKLNEKYSPVIKTKVLKSFTYDLTAPAQNALVPFANAATLTYKCKMSNTHLLDAGQSDYMVCGLLIKDFKGIPLFGAKLMYVFNAGGNPDILIEVCDRVTGMLQSQLKRGSELIATGKLNSYDIYSLDDLVKVDKATGVIEFTEKLVKVPFFNVIPISGGKGLNLPMIYEKGTSYQWDIQDWGSNSVSLNDDTALNFVKMYSYIDENAQIKYCRAASYGNNSSSGANAVNGCFTFTVGN